MCRGLYTTNANNRRALSEKPGTIHIEPLWNKLSVNSDDDRHVGRGRRKSQECESELESVRRETAVHEKASHDYTVTGSKIIELAKNAHNFYSAGFDRTGPFAQKHL